MLDQIDVVFFLATKAVAIGYYCYSSSMNAYYGQHLFIPANCLQWETSQVLANYTHA